MAVLRDVTRRKLAEEALRESEERFQEMARNIEEIFWTLDAENMKVLYVNPAYETITGRPCESLQEDPKSYEEVIHPEDRVRVLSRLGESIQTGQLDEEFHITKPDGAIRWVWVRGFPVRDSAGIVRRLVGTAQHVSARKSAEEDIARNLDRAESAGAEADAFRKTTLALTRNLSMDYVLDTLLQSLLKLVPCESARILLVEADTRLFLAREVQGCETNRRIPKSPATFDAKGNEFLMHVLAGRNSLLIQNTAVEAGWVAFKVFSISAPGCVCRSLHRNRYSDSFRSAIVVPRRLTRNICALRNRSRFLRQLRFRMLGFTSKRKSFAPNSSKGWLI